MAVLIEMSSEASDYLRMVADLLWAHQDAGTEEIQIAVDSIQRRRTECECTGTANLTRSAQMRSTTESCRTSVYISNCGNLCVASQRCQDSIATFPHAGLDGHERGEALCCEFCNKKLGDVIANGFGSRRWFIIATGSSFRSVSTIPAMRDGSTSMMGDRFGRRRENSYFATMRWIGGLIDVMHAEERRRVSPVQFDKHRRA